MTPRRTLWLSLLAGLLVARVGAAVCPVTTACNDSAAILGNPQCCGANNCVIDGTLTLSGATCALDFDGRDLTISGTVNVGSNTLRLSAASITISGQVNAKGAGQNPGGNVTLVTSGGRPTALRLTSGGSGPRIDISGAGRGAGVLQIMADGDVSLEGRIEASALVTAGDGGRVEIETPGAIVLNASIAATGGGFGTGGTIDLLPAGDITLESSVKVTANGGDGGDVTIESNGALLLVPSARIEASGLSTQAGFGGTVTIAAASADIQGVLESKGGGDPAGDVGGDGGEITVDVATGPLLLTRNSSSAIVVEGGGGGSAGVVALTTNSPTNGTLVIDAAISAGGRGGSAVRPGGGGEISIDSSHALDVKKVIDAHGTGAGTGEVELAAARDLTITNNIVLEDPALGGSLTLEADHDLTVNADIRAKATGNGGGGIVSLSAGRDVLIRKKVVDASASGSNPGGDIAIDAGRNITLEKDGIIRANGGGTAAGGAIDIHAGFFELAGNLVLDGDILARGGSTAAASGAVIQLRGCQVAIGGRVDSTGDSKSLNTITARTSITVTGEVRATASGANTLVHLGSAPSFGNKVSPPFMTSSQPECAPDNSVNCLVPCPNCGNGTLEFPEQCEPTANNCGTCSSRCRMRTCDDGAPCTTNGCDPEFGCINGPVADGTTCVDTDPCTPASECLRGACLGERNCDDDDQCTTDSCNGANGCAHVPLDCDDDNPCTLGDSCDAETGCTHTGLKQCPAGEVCDPANGNCVPKPCQNPAACADNNPCTSEACTGGFCAVTALSGTECDKNNNRCDGVAICQAGACVDQAPCEADQDPCTVDDCIPAVGCTHEKIPGCCNQEDDCAPVTVCTTCEDNQCGTEDGCCTTDSDCDDDNPCTADGTCAGNSCPAKQPLSGVSCGNLCAPAECVAGECVAGTPKQCPDDNDPCTDDFCDPATGECAHTPIDGCCIGTPGECGDICSFCQLEVNRCASVPGCVACELDTDCDPDGRCTGNACGTDGKCTTVEPTSCNDNIPGTNDICTVDGNGAPVCRHVCLNSAACDDGNACNGTETCNTGTCAAGPAPTCDDGDACTIESCDPAQGCIRTDAQAFATVRCELDNIADALAGAAPEDVSAQVRSKIERLLTKARAKLAAAEAAGTGKKALKALAAVKGQAKMIRGVVKAAVKKRKMSGALGELILGASDGAGQAAQTLRSQLRT